MQRKKYFQWITIAVIAIAAVVLLFILILKNKKQQNQTTDTTTATPSATPISNASDLPTTAPSTSPIPTVIPTSDGIDHKALARAAYANKQYTVAISEYLQAISMTAATTELATLWHELGNTYRDNQNLNEAVSAYDKSLSANAQLGDAYLSKAAVQWSQNKKDDAITTLETGIDKNATRKQDLQSTLDVYKAMNK